MRSQIFCITVIHGCIISELKRTAPEMFNLMSSWKSEGKRPEEFLTLLWRWKQYISPNLLYPSATLQGGITYKITICILTSDVHECCAIGVVWGCALSCNSETLIPWMNSSLHLCQCFGMQLCLYTCMPKIMSPSLFVHSLTLSLLCAGCSWVHNVDLAFG